MEPVEAEIEEKLYSGDQAEAPFLDPEIPAEVRLSVKHLQQDGATRRHQRDMGHALTTGLEALETGLEALERASGRLLRAAEAMEDGPAKEGILESHREMTQAATTPLGHALRLIVSQFNKIGQNRRANIASGTPDRILAEQIKIIPWASTVCSPLA